MDPTRLPEARPDGTVLARACLLPVTMVFADGAHGPSRSGLFTPKPDGTPRRRVEGEHGSSARSGVLDLTALGIGAIIGTGIFVIIGEAIGDSGPGDRPLASSLAGITCIFSALSYAELASTIPVSGSAYTYALRDDGRADRLDHRLGPDPRVRRLGRRRRGRLGRVPDELLDSLFGFSLPDSISSPPGDGGTVNLPAAFLVLAVAGAADPRRPRERAHQHGHGRVKLVVLALFIVARRSRRSTADNFTPFTPTASTAWSTRRALIFFAYIGFDAISTVGRGGARTRDATCRSRSSARSRSARCSTSSSRSSPIGALPADKLAGSRRPAGRRARQGAGFDVGGRPDLVRRAVAITSVVLTSSTARRGSCSPCAATACCRAASPRSAARAARRCGSRSCFGVLIAVLAALVPLSEIAKLVNIGTLFAFLIVNIGVIILRRTQPDLERGFRVPFVPVFPLIGAALCIYLMTTPRARPGCRFGVWLLLGLVIYFVYGRNHSRLHRGDGPDEGARRHLGVATPPRPGACVASRAAMRVDYGLDAPARGARLRDRGRALGRRDGRADRGRPAGPRRSCSAWPRQCSWRPSSR